MSEDPGSTRTDSTPTHAAGWHDNPDADGLRYWDGTRWTDSFHPGRPAGGLTKRETLWALALGFGATGAVGVVAIPLLAFYFPLGFGIGGLALGVAAATSEGDTPWYAGLAVLAALGALASGINAYSEFEDRTSGVQDAIEALGS